MSIDDIVIRLIDLPTKVRGITTIDADGIANIYLNARIDMHTQYEALKHELTHVERNDFDNNMPIEFIEG